MSESSSSGHAGINVRPGNAGTCHDFASNQVARSKNWFAVFTAPRHEKRVKEHLYVREIENFLPLLEKPRQWKDGSKGILQLPLFPNYIFVRIGNGERIPVLEVPGVVSIVGGGRGPLPVADSYIRFLRDGVQEGKIEPYPYLKEGVRMRIRSGVMAGMEGVLLRRKNSCRVVITLEMIMKSVTVEVRIEDIEPLDREHDAYRENLPPDAV
jgi:transcription antitermination factor NusG